MFNFKNKITMKQINSKIDSLVNEIGKEKILEYLNNGIKKEFHYTDIKTFEDACEKLGIYSKNVYNSELDTIDEIAYKKLKIVFKGINNGWQPNWLDSSQYKYYPYFKAESNYKSSGASGFGFSDCSYGNWNAFVGSRLCTYSSEVAKYIGKQFEDLYSDYLK